MKIDKNLYLVVPVERADEVVVYIHAAPISRECFDQNYMLIGKAFNAIYDEGLGATSGPRLAMKLLRTVARDMNQLAAVEKGLFVDMRQRMNVVAPGDNGWTHMPIDVALKQHAIDEDDLEEAENAIAFFTVVWSMHKKRAARGVMTGAAILWDAQLSSLNAMAFSTSLSTSTKLASTGAKEPKEPQLPIPS